MRTTALLIAAALAFASSACSNADADRPAGNTLAAVPPPTQIDATAAPSFGDAFWRTWSDGNAELAAYDLTIRRYGRERSGTAITIFIPERFSRSKRVKLNRPGSAGDDVVWVHKLNLIADFPTGVYDYNLMTSAFVTMQAINRRPAGHTFKATFSAQEWCGHVWHQLGFGADTVDSRLFSYFESEGDATTELPYPADGIAEDALFHWARGHAWPVLEPGETRTVQLLTAARLARLRHAPTTWVTATLSRSSEPVEVTVPAGTFLAWQFAVEVASGRRWLFDVEADAPDRILAWELIDSRDGAEAAQLIRSARQPYWSQNDHNGTRVLETLGLTERPPRTP